MTPKDAVEKLIKAAGSQGALAEALSKGLKKKCTQSNVANWLHRDKQISRNWVLVAHRKFPQVASLHQMRPDLYPKDQQAS